MPKKRKINKFIKELLSGEKYYSILFYIVVVYLLFVYVALPSVYAFSPISYISAVVSGSMEHTQPTIQFTYNQWLLQHGFNSSVTDSWPFQNGINIGDLAIAYKATPQQINVGDVIIFKATYQGVSEEVIHRVINISVVNGTYYYTTKGDANPTSLQFEYNIPYSAVIGKVNAVVPFLGYPKYLEYLLASWI